MKWHEIHSSCLTSHNITTNGRIVSGSFDGVCCTYTMVEWTHDQYSCCEDGKICAQVLFCPCYLFGKTAHRVGKNRFLCGLALLIPCVNIYAFATVRHLIRKHLRIDGTGSDDCIITVFCGPCALAQEAREVQHEGHKMLRD